MAVSINVYNKFKEYIGDATIDLDGDTFKGELYNSSHSFTATHNQRSDISANALATANGYTNPGQNLTSVTWVESAGTVTWNAANLSWTASGGSIGPARHCVLYDDTTTTPVDALCFSIDFGQDETAGVGTDFIIDFNDSTGIFQLS